MPSTQSPILSGTDSFRFFTRRLHLVHQSLGRSQTSRVFGLKLAILPLGNSLENRKWSRALLVNLFQVKIMPPKIVLPAVHLNTVMENLLDRKWCPGKESRTKICNWVCVVCLGSNGNLMSCVVCVLPYLVSLVSRTRHAQNVRPSRGRQWLLKRQFLKNFKKLAI